MKTLRSLYYWIIGLMYFSLVCLLLIFMILFFPVRIVDPWLKKRFKFLFQLMNCPVEVTGEEHIHPDKTCLFMSNHHSFFDVPFLQAYVPVLIRGVEAKQHFRWPVYGWIIGRLGNIPIDRKNIHRSIQSIRRAQGNLESGLSMIIMPEGHRTLDGKLRPFKKLPFFLAKQSGAPIIPVGISGLYTLMPKGGFQVHPITLKIHFGEPISVDIIKNKDLDDLMKITRDRIKSLIEYP